MGPKEEPLPFRSNQEIEDFLRTAKVISFKEISTGVTKPLRLRLIKDGIQVDAIFRTVDDLKKRWESRNGLKLNFHDYYLFDNLIYNDDRNQTNILIGSDWKLWFIDSTRAFRPYRQLKHPDLIFRCEAAVWQKLKNISPEMIRNELNPFLKVTEINTLIKRHQLIVDHIQDRIDQRGESAIIF